MSFAEQLAEHFIARQSILERYIDLCPIPCFIVNKAGKTIFINEAYQQAYDMRFDQVENDGWQKLIHPDDLTDYLQDFKRLVDGDINHIYSEVRTLIRAAWHTSIIRITHVPGNGYIGYVFFQCSNNSGCPVRALIDDYLRKPHVEARADSDRSGN